LHFLYFHQHLLGGKVKKNVKKILLHFWYPQSNMHKLGVLDYAQIQYFPWNKRSNFEIYKGLTTRNCRKIDFSRLYNFDIYRDFKGIEDIAVKF